MAQVVLSGLGSAVAGPVGGLVGGLLGAAADRVFLNSLSPVRQVGRRLQGLQLSGSSQGDPVKQVFGRARVAGTVIWAARLQEHRETTRANKTSGRTESFGYSLSLAVALCEGPIDGIGRIWADGQLLDQSKVAYRLYRGTDDQGPDALIAAIEGSAPGYRGLAYMVFEALDLTPFGNRAPNLSVEVFRRPRGPFGDLENQIEGVCLIPGAGEFVYATTAVAALSGLTRASWETQHTGDGRTDFAVALDQLEAALPNLKTVNLVVSWFGTSLDAGSCEIRPRVETADKVTRPLTWGVAGVAREDAHVVSQIEGRPAYGGTPSDQVVVEAIVALKARGYAVTLIPFILMDCEGYPWRGRIIPESAVDAAAFVTGEWGLGRFVRHVAELGVQAGGVDCVLLGSELRGLTTFREDGNYPVVDALIDLAAEVRGIVGPDVQISYAADWSEYFGHQADGEVYFHFDPLWADDNIDCVGIDWYAPLTDWRDGTGHLDYEEAGSIYAPAYLESRIRGGEGFDWYYASDADRTAQVRTAISDGAYGEPWVYRPKDVQSWWSNSHYNRPGGVRSVTPTAWVPMSKPVRLIEIGCGAVDKGANAPNLFLDPKSSESAVPPFSNGARDDAMQRAYLSAFYRFYAQNNPVSPVYGGEMIADMAVWCWDARPYPYFPQLANVWGDTVNWRTGHWLNGRTGAGEVGNLIADVAAQAGVPVDDLDLSEVSGTVEGYVIEQPMTASDALGPVLGYLGLEMAERGGQIACVGTRHGVDAEVSAAELAFEEASSVTVRRDLAEAPSSLTLRCYDPDRDYQLQAVHARQAGGAGQVALDVPLCLSAAQAVDYADYVLGAMQGALTTVEVAADPALVLRLEGGDGVMFDGEAWRVAEVDQGERPAVRLTPVPPLRVLGQADPSLGGGVPGMVTAGVMTGVRVLDLPCFGAEETDARPVVVATADPWGGAEVYAGAGPAGLRLRATIGRMASVGYTLTDLPIQRGNVLLRGASVDVYLEGTAPVSTTYADVLAGGNFVCVRAANGEWELVQYLSVAVLGVDQYRLGGLVRGQWGSEPARLAGSVAGAEVVMLPSGFVRAQMGLDEIGLSRLWRAGPVGFGGAAQGAVETTAVWAGLGLRPRAPVHGRVKRSGADVVVSWLRAPRYGGDSWDAEPPLCEDYELYRVQVFDGADVVRTVEVSGPLWVYEAAAMAVDFPGGFGVDSRVEVAQKSQVLGWGPVMVVGLG